MCERLQTSKAPPSPPPPRTPNRQPWNHLRSSERLLLNAPQALVESSANIVPVPSVHASQPVSPGEGRRFCAEAEGALIGWLPDMAASSLTSCILSLTIHEQAEGGGQRSNGRSEGFAAVQTRLP